jgi:hypothetical protein
LSTTLLSTQFSFQSANLNEPVNLIERSIASDVIFGTSLNHSFPGLLLEDEFKDEL